MSTLFKRTLYSCLKRGGCSSISKITLALGLALSAGTFFTPMTAAQASNNPTVQTNKGPVQGFIKNGVAEFLGIPYAKPPLGNLRWRPPLPHDSWTKTLQATAYGSNCAQITTLGVFAGPVNTTNEDCLFLNVFTPNLNAAKNEKVPVLMFVHGGGNVDGESTDYDGSKLAAQGHVVVVTVNYRLGLIGFFAHPALDAEGHLFGNYGVLDQQLALKWIQQNIAQFGGDKNNVTLSGQSAGSKNTIVNLVSPLAAGLFKRVILESLFQEPTPLDYAEQLGSKFGVAAGCPSGATATVAKCLRNLTTQQVMNLQGTQATQGPYGQNFVADGQISPTEGIAAAVQEGHFNHVPVLGGTTEDEGTFTLGVTEYWSGPPRVAFTPTDYTNYVARTFTGNSGPGGAPPAYPKGTDKKVANQFPLVSYASPELAMEAIVTASTYACPLHHLLEELSSQVPVYYYEFQDRTAPYYFPNMPGYQHLAAHTIDLQFLFPLYHGGPQGTPHALNNQEENLSDEMVAAWTNFAWNSNPNGTGTGIWQTFSPKNGASILAENVPVLTTIANAQFIAEHKCNFWDQILTY